MDPFQYQPLPRFSWISLGPTIDHQSRGPQMLAVTRPNEKQLTYLPSLFLSKGWLHSDFSSRCIFPNFIIPIRGIQSWMTGALWSEGGLKRQLINRSGIHEEADAVILNWSWPITGVGLLCRLWGSIDGCYFIDIVIYLKYF